MELHGNTSFDMRLRPLFLQADVIRKEEKKWKKASIDSMKLDWKDFKVQHGRRLKQSSNQ